jgi:group I intron endonuclease
MSQNFTKGKKYKITNDFNNDIYVGSTCDTLVKRFIMHKSNSKTRQTKLYHFIRDIGFERFRIELIEDFPCTDKYESRQRENYWIREIGTLNLRNSFITEEDKVASRSSYNIQYCETNKDKITDYKKKLYDSKNEPIVCCCGCTIKGYNLKKHENTTKHINKIKI